MDMSILSTYQQSSFSYILDVLSIVALIFVFKKAGEKGWKGIIPIYNTYILFKISGEKDLFAKYFCFLLLGALSLGTGLGLMVGGVAFGILLLVASIVLLIAAIVFEFKMYKSLSKCFGKSDAYAWGLLFLQSIFLIILGFGKNEYQPKEQLANEMNSTNTTTESKEPCDSTSDLEDNSTSETEDN